MNKCYEQAANGPLACLEDCTRNHMDRASSEAVLLMRLVSPSFPTWTGKLD